MGQRSYGEVWSPGRVDSRIEDRLWLEAFMHGVRIVGGFDK